MIRRLRVKFVCINMAIVTIMLCVIFGMIYQATARNLERESIQMLVAVAANPMSVRQPGQAPMNVELPYFTVEIDAAGNPGNVGGGYFEISDPAYLASITAAATEQNTHIGILEQDRLRFCEVSTPESHYVIFADMSSEDSTVEHLVITCTVIGIVSFILFLVISIALSFWAVKPVEIAWKQQKQFVADASHELKTPLTVILTNAELLSHPSYTDAQRRQFGQNIQIMSNRMKGLVEDLLELARIDHGLPAKQLQDIDLSALAEETVLTFEPIFYEAQRTLNSQLDENITIHGDPRYMTQLLQILLDNARKYSSEGSEVCVALNRCSRRSCRISVHNLGPAIPQAQQKNIFKRFYRQDEARSDGESFGLGLAIAEEIATQHGGKIWLQSRDGETTFYVQLPMA